MTCLVTGNLQPIGWGKMAALGLKNLFSQPPFGGFGSDFCSGNTGWVPQHCIITGRRHHVCTCVENCHTRGAWKLRNCSWDAVMTACPASSSTQSARALIQSCCPPQGELAGPCRAGAHCRQARQGAGLRCTGFSAAYCWLIVKTHHAVRLWWTAAAAAASEIPAAAGTSCSAVLCCLPS